MNRRQAPRIATWLLEHFTPGQSKGAIQGDLLEEFQSGRTSGWYWRQALAALAITASHEIRAHRLALSFAATWTLAATACWHLTFWSATHAAAFMLPWPYAPLAGTGAIVIESLWFGLALYGWLYSLLHKGRAIHSFARAFWLAPSLYFTLCIVFRIISHPLGIRVENLDAFHPILYFFSLVGYARQVRVPSQTNARTTRRGTPVTK